jgi:hypothetical protein
MDINSLPKACVILGAGASHDAVNQGSRIRDARWRPPLAKSLFDIQGNPYYATILDRYPDASYLAQILEPRLSDDNTVGMEAELRRLADHSSPIIRQKFKFVLPYIRDVILECTLNYADMPGSYVQLVNMFLADHPHHLLFINLNYDDFLEKALNRFDTRTYHFKGPGNYTDPSMQAKVLKLHGSVDWIVRVAPDREND